MKVIHILFACAVLLAASACGNHENVPPNDIGMILTKEGYKAEVFASGEVNIKSKEKNDSANRLVLMERGTIAKKEIFADNGDLKSGSVDGGDHRCLTGGDKAPLSLEVDMVFALPYYDTPEGKKDLLRIFSLGEPIPESGKERVFRISTEALYDEQVKSAVRRKIHKVCAEYRDFDAAFTAFRNDGDDGLAGKIRSAIIEALAERQVPLRLVSAFASDLKPDRIVLTASVEQLAMVKRGEATRTSVSFGGFDPNDTNWRIYQMQVSQQTASRGNTNALERLASSRGGVMPEIPLSQNNNY